jgi:hypothetical protein
MTAKVTKPTKTIEAMQVAGAGAAQPALDGRQLGHLRHIVRLSRQVQGDWSCMWPFDATQEGDDAYRYQLAYMGYVLALTQYHHTPAYRELYRETLRALIDQMLRIDVWGYWELASKGSHVTDPDLAELGGGWDDPAARMNVMYSGHLLMMVGLYEMLYRDHRYDEEGSLTFKHRPPFHGLGPQDFHYDHKRLVEVVHAEFERNGFLGCECEPNAIFVHNNLPALLGFVLYDHTHGTDVARPAFERFQKAWSERTGLFSADKDAPVPLYWRVRQQAEVTEGAAHGSDNALWWVPFMRVFDKAYAETIYARARDRVAVRHQDGAIGADLEPYRKAHEEYQLAPAPGMIDPVVLGVHDLGMMAFAAAELGDEETRAGVLAFADTRLDSAWEDGAFWYRRNDDLAGQRYCTCLSGNALLAAARLNVKDGFWRLVNQPWSVEPRERELEVVDVEYPDVLITHASSDEAHARLLVGTAPGGAGAASSSIGIAGVDASARWTVEVDGRLIARVGGSDEEATSDPSRRLELSRLTTDRGIQWRPDEGKLTLDLDFSEPRTVAVARA